MAKLINKLKAAGADAAEGRILKLDPDWVVMVEDPAHPLYDPRIDLPLDYTLVLGIATDGVRRPIEVRHNGENGKGHPILEVISGRQRVKSARFINDWAGKLSPKVVRDHFSDISEEEVQALLSALSMSPKIKIPALAIAGEDNGQLIGRMIEENMGQVSETIRSRAVKFKNAIKFSLSKAEVCRMARTSPKSLDLHLKFLELHPDAQAYIENENPKLSIVEQIGKVPQARQPAVVDGLRLDGARTAKEVERVAAPAREAEPPKPKRRRRMTPKRARDWYEELKAEPSEDGDDNETIEGLVKAVLLYMLEGDRTKLSDWDKNLVPSFDREGLDE